MLAQYSFSVCSPPVSISHVMLVCWCLFRYSLDCPSLTLPFFLQQHVVLSVVRYLRPEFRVSSPRIHHSPHHTSRYFVTHRLSDYVVGMFGVASAPITGIGRSCSSLPSFLLLFVALPSSNDTKLLLKNS
jgi:hypothetical protein